MFDDNAACVLMKESPSSQQRTVWLILIDENIALDSNTKTHWWSLNDLIDFWVSAVAKPSIYLVI